MHEITSPARHHADDSGNSCALRDLPREELDFFFVVAIGLAIGDAALWGFRNHAPSTLGISPRRLYMDQALFSAVDGYIESQRSDATADES